MNELSNKKIPLGIEDYGNLVGGGYYYIDKTLLIKNIIDTGNKVICYTRPRRFGKTLNLSMLNYFFNIDGSGKNLFANCALAQAGGTYLQEQGKYPVISLSLKDLKQANFQAACAKLRFRLQSLLIDNSFLLHSPKVHASRKHQLELLQRDTNLENLTDGMVLLTQMLYEHYGQDTVILIDEYDVPLDAGYIGGFYQEILALVRSLLSATCKTNPHLRLSVHTGCLRIAGESIYTGFNNPTINTILTKDNSAHMFGFTPAEVLQMLQDYGQQALMPQVKQWYDGYLFGTREIYNPWSILNFVQTARTDPQGAVKPYWINTSGNDLLLKLIDVTLDGSSTRNDIERLLEGEPVNKTLNENISYSQLESTPDAVWNILVFTGYLKPLEQPDLLTNDNRVPLALVNREVWYILRQKLQSWYQQIYYSNASQPLVQALEEGKPERVEAELNQLLMRTVSFHDYAENFYHGFLAGLLAAVKQHLCKSNRESGLGVSDIQFTRQDRAVGVVIELKMSKSERKLPSDAASGLKQALKLKYVSELKAMEYKRVHVYGIACHGKNCKVVMQPE